MKRRFLIPLLLAAAAVIGILALNVYFASTDVIVFMYHSVREKPVNPADSDLSVKTSEFEKQLAYFAKSGRKTIFAEELTNLSKGDKCIVITLDDGYEDNYTDVFPLLKKYNCKATIFMITSLIDAQGYLSSEQIREMTESGLVSVQSHTVSHEPLALGDKTYEDVDEELRASKAALEQISGRPVTGLAVPNGSYDAVVLDVAKKYYDVIFTGMGIQPYDYDVTDVNRTGIYRRHTVWDVKAMTKYRGFYIVKRTIQKVLGNDI